MRNPLPFSCGLFFCFLESVDLELIGLHKTGLGEPVANLVPLVAL
jgi:hypothetical protein